MTRRNFVLRTIQNGRVKILGRWFVPDARFMQYDGRLDGTRFSFGLYWNSLGINYMCCLWGTEKLHQALNNDEEFDRLYKIEPQDIDGSPVWYWWFPDPRLETDRCI